MGEREKQNFPQNDSTSSQVISYSSLMLTQAVSLLVQTQNFLPHSRNISVFTWAPVPTHPGGNLGLQGMQVSLQLGTLSLGKLLL